MAEAPVKRRTILFLTSLALSAAAVLAVLTVCPKEPSAAPVGVTIDIAQAYRDAFRPDMPGLDENYQRYIGVLDVLRSYPAP
jgi:hypothetical protein